MTHPAFWQQLQTSFEQDLPITSQLIDTLELERQSLEQRDYDQFNRVITSKQQLLSTLEQHAKQRQQLFQQAGYHDEQSTLHAAEIQAPTAASQWKQLAEQWQRCQHMNEVNERITKRTRLVVGQILDLLRGQNSNQRLYNKAGSTHPASGGRSITSA